LLKKNQEDAVTVSDQLLPDNTLVERIAQGDAPSFETIFHRYYDKVYGILFRLVGTRSEAEDLTQEVFLKLYQQPPRRGQEHNVGGWLYRVATNTGYNHIRGRQRRWQRNRWLVPGMDRSAPSAGDNNPEQQVEDSQARTQAQAALSRLKPRQVQLLLLRQMGLSYAEVADACEIAPGSVGKLLSRAARDFARAYERAGG
jgi:RNA polymerase sigma-70 factor (ECF subfamily)